MISLGALAVGCSGLSALEADECGNRVVEAAAGEACDGQPGCGAPSSAHPCRYVCSWDDGITCPTGYGCGVDDVCRRASGVFEPMSSGTAPIATDVTIADVNADHCLEIVRSSLRGVSVSSFDSRADELCPAREQLLPTAATDLTVTAAPLLADLTRNGQNELLSSGPGLVTTAGLYAHLTLQSSEILPVIYSNYRSAKLISRVLRVRRQGVDVAVLVDSAGALTELVDSDEQPTAIGAFAAFPDVLVAGDLDAPTETEAERCDEVIAAASGATSLEVLRFCSGVNQAVPLASVALSGGARIRARNASVSIADVDGDARPDVLVNTTDGAIHVAYGQGDGTFHSSPGTPAIPDQQTSVLTAIAPSLAAELANPDTIFVAANFDATTASAEIVPLPCPANPLFHSTGCEPREGACEAAVGDVDDDGQLDIVSSAAQLPDVVVRRGAADGTFHVQTIASDCPPHGLSIGDFDADGIGDVAFYDQHHQAPHEPQTRVVVAHGRSAEMPVVEHLGSLFEDGIALAAGSFFAGAQGEQLVAVRLLDEGPDPSGVTFVDGRGTRLMFSPYYPALSPEAAPEELEDAHIVAMAAGRFGGADANGIDGGVAAITRQADTRLWLFEAEDGAANIEASVSSDAVACEQCVLTAVDTNGDGRDELVLLGDKTVVVYESGEGGFTETLQLAVAHTFVSVDTQAHPPEYVARPIVADLDGDGIADILARAEDGAIVALWGRTDGSFDESVLVQPSACPDVGPCAQPSVALADVDADGIDELVLVTADGLTFHRISAERDMTEVPVTVPVTPSATSSDYTAVAAGDLDGDGVADLTVMRSATYFDVLRGVPVLE